jgi:molybdenum cofactor cytidylyltransferase
LGFAATEIQRQVSTQGLKIVVNPDYQEGMASSLRAGIAALDPLSQAVLIVLADQPCVLPETLDRLIAHYQSMGHQSTGAQIVIPTYKGFRGNPVLLDRSVFQEVMQIRGDVGCRAIFGTHTENISKLAVDDAGILFDVDTSGDLQSFLAAQVRGDRRAGICPPVSDLESRMSEAGIGVFAGQPELVVVGREAVAIALLKFGQLLHFTTTLVDPLLSLNDVAEADRVLHRLDFSLLQAQRSRYVVVASRGQFDEDALEQALQSQATYVGLVANKKRSQELMGNLQRKGLGPERLAQMHTSAGLDIGAETPEEIALSIMAEIVVERRSAANSN